MALKVEKQTVFWVSHFELERFIKEETGQEYEIPNGEEVGNDSFISKTIDGKPTEYELKSYAKHKSGKYINYILRDIMNCLCEEGKLEPGKYLISICW